MRKDTSTSVTAPNSISCDRLTQHAGQNRDAMNAWKSHHCTISSIATIGTKGDLDQRPNSRRQHTLGRDMYIPACLDCTALSPRSSPDTMATPFAMPAGAAAPAAQAANHEAGRQQRYPAIHCNHQLVRSTLAPKDHTCDTCGCLRYRAEHWH